ncbi:TlpA disulfide reductase family protein [Sphingobacterium spiritivorum]|uniref:TlpA disulfide reductase family protein n=1 Tax=Sphingobacterium spiritivorum TaxID=258 RepID=UPI000E0E9C39|nr:TlpA disulfide reductase family protein [Sphingobacterium spiritivorum]
MKTSFKRNVLLSLTALLIIIFSFSFYKYWNNYVNYASFTGSVNEKNLTKIEGLNNMREIVNVRHQTDLIVLDFWHTSCGICFRKFPVLQKLSNKYLHSQKVRVLAINIPLKSDTNQMAFNMLFSNSYTFENIIAIDSSLYKKFNVNVFPTTLLLDKHDNVLFRGDIEDVDNKIINLLKN